MSQNSRASRPASPAADAMTSGFYPRYLAAKQGIDDRALNRQVWEALRQALPLTVAGEPLRIVEIGAGIGTMVERLVDWGLVRGPASYLATDSSAAHLEAARQHLGQWAAGRGHALSWSGPGPGRGRLRTAEAAVELELKVASAETMADRSAAQGPFHLLIAHAVLDLVDFTALLPQLFQQLGQNGLAYLTCNFDGESVFLPEYQGREELEILRRYHASMDERLAGSSHTGRRLLTFLAGRGLHILAAGSADWVVYPTASGYAADEAFFLHAIIETVERELSKQPALSPPGLTTWARCRHRQVEEGELIFLARHLDLLVRLPDSGP